VLERRAVVGGAAVSERVFAGFDPNLSLHACLVSLLPRQTTRAALRDVTGGDGDVAGWRRLHDGLTPARPCWNAGLRAAMLPAAINGAFDGMATQPRSTGTRAFEAVRLDQIDRSILAELQADARTPLPLDG